MGLLNIFSSKNPEDYEIKGDKFVEAGAYGKAIMEYEHAIERLDKTAPWDDGLRQSLQEKIQNSRESLALEHKKTAEDMLEAGYDEDARQYIQLALELTENPDIISDLKPISAKLNPGPSKGFKSRSRKLKSLTRNMTGMMRRLTRSRRTNISRLWSEPCRKISRKPTWTTGMLSKKAMPR